MSEEKKVLVEASSDQLALPLDVRGTAFQRRVWHALREIPSGMTISYSEIAKRIGMPKATRAVAAACAANRIAVAIPCHRVIRKDALHPPAITSQRSQLSWFRRYAEATRTRRMSLGIGSLCGRPTFS